MAFPAGFVWGAASSAYQIEGGHDADGKGPSTWDAFSQAPGNVYMNHTGDVACDHYHRFREDVELMRQMGLRAYRFSISWARVLPEGTGRVNPAGLAFYSRLVDALQGAGITPWVTLFHWDLPLALYARGGWLNREIRDWFGEYTRVVVEALSDRVTHWMTLNEPQIFLGPSEKEGLQTSNAGKGHAERLLAAHNALLAHGRGVEVIRANAKTPPQVGWAPIGRVKVPAPRPDAPPLTGVEGAAPSAYRPEDVEAARRATHAVTAKDFWNNAWFADPVFLGRYPEDGLRLYHDDLAHTADGRLVARLLRNAEDLRAISPKLDFYGINVYDAERIRMSQDGRPEKVPFPPGHPQNALRWFIEPEALYFGPKWLYERYKVPMAITENGFSGLDWVGVDGLVRDPQRIDYTRRYLLALSRAIRDGADVRGYFHWSILDNFEWQQGYKERFGLIHVEYHTLQRTVKESGWWYKHVIETNGASLG